MQWWDIYLQVPDHLSDAASAHLQEQGSSAVVFHEQATLHPHHDPCIIMHPDATAWTVVQGALPDNETLPQHLAALQGWLNGLAEDVPGVQFYSCPVHNDDYLTRWQQFFQPLCFGDRLLIRPPWETEPVPEHLTCLTLNPGPAFGTGTHPSTRLCLLLLIQYARHYQGKTLLDIGCGSGILSLAALQLGWQQAVGVDLDAQALPVALENATLNGLQERAHFLHGSWSQVTGLFPCIVANIHLGPLVDMLQPLATLLAPGGILFLSGILTAQEATMCLAATRAHLAVQQRLEDDGWVALAFRHASDVSLDAPHV